MGCSHCGCSCHDEEDEEYELQQQEDVRECARLIRAVWVFAPSGGDLHCAINDGNLEGNCCEDFIGNWRERREPLEKKRQTYAGLEKAERACVAALLPLSLDERYAATNLAFSEEKL